VNSSFLADAGLTPMVIELVPKPSECASLRKSASEAAHIAREGRTQKRQLWPAEVLYKGRDVFSSYKSLTGLKALGWAVERVRIDIRSRRAALASG
jgi:hypothetical protein